MANRYHVEAWSLPLATSTRTVARVPFIKGSAAAGVSGLGRGSITVRKDWSRLADVTDPDNGVGSLIKIFRDNVLIPELSFFGRRDARNLEDEATGMVVISGPGIGDVMNFGRVENFDYPVSPTIDPDWSWGAGANLTDFRNASFEENPDDATDTGTGFEDETLDGWGPIPGSGDFNSNDTDPTVDNGDARTGTFSLTWDPGAVHSGIQRKITLSQGERYQFQVYLKSATSGRRFTFGITPFGVKHHTNAFTYNDIAMAELENVASNGLGTPGGSTDGTWQVMDLDVTMAITTKAGDPVEATLYVQFDHHGVANGPVARIDDSDNNGPGLGLFPWQQTPDPSEINIFLQDTSPPVAALDGDAVARIVVEGSSADAGTTQLIEGVTVGRTYTARAFIHHDLGSNQDFRIRIRRGTGGSIIQQTTASIATGGTWTKISVTAVADCPNIFVSIIKATPGEFWVDKTSLIEGQDSASWGDINQQLMDDAAVDHTAEAPPFDRDTLGFVDYTSFTNLLTSAGDAWVPATVDYRAKRGKKYRQIGADGARMGFESIVRDTTSGIVLEIFNPYDWSSRTGGIGVDLTGTGVPEIMYGAGVTSGPIIRGPSTANRWHVEGEAGLFEVRRDLGSIADYDTREGYEGSIDFLAGETLAQIADQTLSERTIPTTALKTNLAPHEGDNVPVPFRDFNLGDTYPINLIGDFTGPMRAMQITVDFAPGIGSYTVEWDQVTFTSDPMKATIEAVRRLLEQFDTLDKAADLSGPAVLAAPPFAGPIEATFLVAASNARPDVKAVADFICDGTDDHIEINAAWLAIETLNIEGGRVMLSAGLFNIRDGVVVNPDQGEPGIMSGAGRGATVISMTAGSDTSAVRVRAGATVRDFSILVTSSAVVTRGALEIDESDSQAYSIAVDTDDGVGIWCDGPRSRVEGCEVIARTDASHGIFVHADARESTIIGNVIHESRQHGIMIDGDAGGTPELTQVLNNKIINPSRQAADTFDGIHMEGPFAADHGPLIEGNIIYKTGGVDFRDGINIAVANVVDVTVVGNVVGAGVGRNAITVDGLRDTVEANRVQGAIDVGGDDNHVEGNTVAIVNDASNGIIVGGDDNFIDGNKVFAQSGSLPAVGLEVLSGATGNVIGTNALDATTPITDAGTGTQYRNHKALSPPFVAGVVATATGVARLRIPEDAFIIDAAAMVDTAPTDADLIVDVHLNGTTIFTSGKPTIAASAFDSGLATPTTRVAAAGDYFTVDVDQVGSTIAGSDLTVVIRYVPVGAIG